MGMLVDWQIAELCEHCGMVDPFEPELLNADSLDIRLGPKVLLELPRARTPGSGIQALDQYQGRAWGSVNLHAGQPPLWLQPGAFLLARTLETFCLPEDVASQYYLKSALAREGYGHSLASLCHAGWRGVLTLEIHNQSGTPLPLVLGMPIGQLTFHRLETRPSRPYGHRDHYHGDQDVQPARPIQG